MHKHFLKFSTAALLGLGLTLSVAQAQDQAAPPAGRRGQMMDPEQELQRMKKQLQLTDDQVNQIRPIMADSRKQMMALRSDPSVAQEDRRAKMQSMRQDSVAKIRAVLSDTQKPEYDAMIAKREQMMQQRQNGAGPGGPPPAANPNQ